MSETEKARIETERKFHNSRFGSEEDFRGHLNRWYAAIESGKAEQDELVKKLAKDKTVLEYGCSDGDLSLGILNLPSITNRAHGIDISDKAIDKANARARSMKAQPLFLTMNAEKLDYSDGMFDLVFGRGIIHHLDLQASLSEIKRVLKPGGRAIFLEPMGHNIALNWYRNRTPSLRTPDEHPIVIADFELAESIIGETITKFYGLTTLLAVPFQKYRIGPGVMKICERIDSLLFNIPLIRKNAWFVLMVMKKSEN